MPTLDTLQLPRIDTSAYGGREARKIAGHLYQVEEQLRYVLGHLDEDNLSEGLKSKIESGGMSSEILQSLDAVTLRVSGQDDAMSELRVSLGGITAAVQEQGGAITQLEQTAQGLAVTVEQNKNDAASALQQTAESIKSTVAATCSTKDELQSTVEQRAESILSTVADGYASKTELRQTVEGLRLTVENSEAASRLTLTAGETKLSSADITLAGVVKFHDLETLGETVINGSNITTGEISANLIKTGVIENHAATTRYDLDNGTIQMGASSGTRVLINRDTIRWYDGSNPTGIFYSKIGSSYIGANSTDTYYGWLPRGNMTGEYYGVKITNNGNAHFKTAKVECNGGSDRGGGWLEADTVKCNTLNVTTGKGRIVDTQDCGIVTMEAMESPIPVFCDNGSGTLDETGTCLLTLHPMFLETAAVNVTPQWHVTAAAPVTVHKNGLCAAVKGEPGTTFDWLCILPQKGREGTYARQADISREEYIHAQDHVAGDRLAAVQREVEALDRQVLEIAQQNDFIEVIFAKEAAA